MKKQIHIFLSLCCSITAFATTDPLQPLLETLSTENEPTEIQLSEIKNQDNTITSEQTEETKASVEIIHSENTVLEKQGESETVEKMLIEHKKIDLPYTEHALIEKYRREYLSNFGKKRLSEIMSRAQPYRPHIRQTLADEGIPLALEFLPVIESDFKTTAVSKSGATGIWQFMENSIAGFLEKNEWIDERHDPWLSTEAAAQKLKYNYSVLNDWELALAAYNMGLNGLRRVMKSAGSSDFWYLAENGYLKTETKNYVPKFIAVADLISNAAYYGIDIPEYDENAAIDFTEITVNKQLNLEVLASVTNIEYDTYSFLNPAFEYVFTPPTEYTLRIPTESKETILNAIEKHDSTTYLKSHRVKQGDTLWSLSRQYNTSVEVLCEINNRSPNAILSIGTVLFLPILK